MIRIKRMYERILELIKEFTGVLQSKGVDNRFWSAQGDIGTEVPLYIGIMYGKDPADYWIQNKKMWEMLGEDTNEIVEEWNSYIKKSESEKLWYLSELSYIPDTEGKLNLPRLSLKQKRDRLAWLCDLSMIMGISYAKSEEKSVEDFARYCGEQYAPGWSESKGKGPASLVSGTFRNMDLWPDFTMEILEESETSYVVKMNRPWADRFGDDGLFYGVTIDEYEKWLEIVMEEIADYLELDYEQKLEEDHLILTIKGK